MSLGAGINNSIPVKSWNVLTVKELSLAKPPKKLMQVFDSPAVNLSEVKIFGEAKVYNLEVNMEWFMLKGINRVPFMGLMFLRDFISARAPNHLLNISGVKKSVLIWDDTELENMTLFKVELTPDQQVDIERFIRGSMDPLEFQEQMLRHPNERVRLLGKS